MAHSIPKGFRFAGVHCGIKQAADRLDLSIVASDVPCTAAGVYTQNLVVAAPVAFDRARTPGSQVQAVVINSGNANACTGERGDRDTAEMARWTAQSLGLPADSVLVMSTGVIGAFLPMPQISEGIRAASMSLRRDDDGLLAAARGIMTTDSRPKVASRQLSTGACVLGIAKGAAMIGPNLATMLGLVVTDAAATAQDCDKMLKDAAEDSFNSVSVDGHTSTNDTVLLLANGAAANPAVSIVELTLAVREVCEELARAIVDDGEGTTHTMEIRVNGCRTKSAARTIGRCVAQSPLVKAAIAGSDPNWGRIVSAAGYAGVPFDPNRISLRLNKTLVYEGGAPASFDETQVSQSLKANRQVLIELQFAEGDAAARLWTTDLTEEYVRLNADYRT